MNLTRVLLVDDEEDFTEVLAERLRTRGLKVDVASNGEDALKTAYEKTFDAVVLDVAMPGMDGMETLKRLRVRNPDLQVILLTGHATIERGIEAIKSGAMEFLEKPADINKLIELIVKARTITEQLTDERIEEAMTNIMRKKGW